MSAWVRGIFVAEDYWAWKNLINHLFFFLLTIICYFSLNPNVVPQVMKIWLRYALPIFPIFYIFFNRSDAVGQYMAPIMLLLLFFPLLNLKHKIISLLSLTIILFHIDARASVLKFLASFGIGLIFYFNYYFENFVRIIIPKIWGFLIILPIVLFTLGVTGIYNIFESAEKKSEKIKIHVVDNGQEDDEEIGTDTRTTIYREVIVSALKNQYILFGNTPAKGNESEFFGGINVAIKRNSKERFENEVSICNIFTYTGIIGVVLYFLIFLKASYLAVYKSNSIFLKGLGLYVAFRWVMAWIEDFTEVNISYVFLMIIIGMCLSPDFRNMNNEDINNWVQNIVRPFTKSKLSPKVSKK